MKHSKSETIEAIKQAILKGDKVYKRVQLPSPQKSGTYFQNSTYASIKSEEIYAQNFKQ